ncbi:MAG: redoxin domain-containing protein [Deltaproteobacteria bacterium]|nr:redoxin domain-containing protein [Deltaproteobacteria bacterium]
MKTTPRFNGYQVSLHLLLVLLGTVVIALFLENQSLRRTTPEQAKKLVSGDTIAAVAGRDLDGGSRELAFEASEKERLLFVFTTVCPACKDNQKNWRALYEQALDRYEIVGISLSSLEATEVYRDTQGLPFPIVIPSDIQAFASDNLIQGVPYTIHLGRDGLVRQSWLGPLPEDAISELTVSSSSAGG